MFHRQTGALKSTLTWEGAEYYRKTGAVPAYDGHLNDLDIEIAQHARADAESVQGGLKMTTRFDEAGRPIREFASTTGRKDWMHAYMSPAHQQIRICRVPPTPAEAAAFEDRWRETQAALAAGNFQLPEF
jgi:hypothetical protein